MKKLLITLLAIVMIFCFVGCNERDTAYDRQVNEFMADSGFVLIERIGKQGDTYMYLVYDAESKVEYILIEGYCETSLCPYYDSNGEVVIYKGE